MICLNKKNQFRWDILDASGNIVARGYATEKDPAMKQMIHYMIEYGQDGPVKYRLFKNRKIILSGSISSVTITTKTTDPL